MGLFDRPREEIEAFISEKLNRGRARLLPVRESIPLAPRTQVIFSEDTGLELGNPGVASRSLLLWDEPEKVRDGRIVLVGPDLPEARSKSLPYAQVLVAGGRFEDHYDSYRDLRDAVYGLRLEGFMARVFPGRQSVWCRVSKKALAGGFDASLLGSGLIRAAKSVPSVEKAEVLLVTSSKEEVEELAEAATGVMEIVEALIKMYEEMNFDCDTCEYVEVCDTVVELRKIRDKLRRETER